MLFFLETEVVKLTKIYTRTGDQGETSLSDGSRVRKDTPRVRAIGAVDEANSAIGLARLHVGDQVDKSLSRIQNDLFDLGADISTPEGKPEEKALRITASQVTWLETEIDLMNTELSPLNSFILPAGSEASSHLHLARAIVRQAESLTVTLTANEAANEEALKYLNRLSDYLFVLARFLNQKGAKDVLWVPGENRKN